jgi:hypothetical protein
MHRRVGTGLVALALVGAVLGVSGCGLPPALTKAQLDSKTLSKTHPKVPEAKKDNCRACHREAPAIKKQP